MGAIVQINFVHDVSEEEAAAFSPERAQEIADQPGLKWKVWLRDPQTKQSGGIYLFETRAAAERYLGGPIVASIKANPRYADVSLKVFDVRVEPSRITRAPLDVKAPVLA